jgi:hypothetical protein
MDRDEKIAQLAEDLEQVRSAVNRNATVLREVMGPMHYRGLLLYSGIASIALCLAFHLVARAYGGFAPAPSWMRAVLVIATAAAVIGGGVAKMLTVDRAARSADRRLSVASFFRRYYGPMIVHLYPPLILMLLGVCAWLFATGRGFYVVGTLGLFSGILMNLLAAAFRQNEYLVFGYWALLAGAASFFVPGLSAALWFAIVFGLGCLAFSTAATLLARRR